MYKAVSKKVQMFMEMPNGKKVDVVAVLKVDKTMLKSDNLKMYIPSAKRTGPDKFEVFVNSGKYYSHRPVVLGTVLYKDAKGTFHFAEDGKAKLEKITTITIEIEEKEMSKELDCYQKAEIIKDLIVKRTGLKSSELQCPREKSDMTPCIARDGELACTGDGTCVGCGIEVEKLYHVEKSQEKEK